ncbi:uncharacterized protein LOC129919039 [Episyrphus balteatus]|uniref:uncharacterized protein LOC129919039 n=1 Tax=Episyrphus balteatus TaxID=286459 RepID=UPI0024860AFA|nr:uncharacterized protein LOC129919039 [Episyrphus balteatus]
MKNIVSLLIALGSWQFIEAMTESEAIGALEGFGDKCEPKPNEDDYKNIVRNTEDVPQSTKCFRLCLMEQMDLIVDNCKLDGEKLTDLLTMAFDGKEEETAEIANHCNLKVGCTDKCDAAHAHSMCILNQMKIKKWPLPELEEDSKQ